MKKSQWPNEHPFNMVNPSEKKYPKEKTTSATKKALKKSDDSQKKHAKSVGAVLSKFAMLHLGCT